MGARAHAVKSAWARRPCYVKMPIIRRREFLKLSASAVAGAMIGPRVALRQTSGTVATAPVYDNIEAYFLKILVGFLKNAAATSNDYTVCDFPEGTKLASCCTPSGKTYV